MRCEKYLPALRGMREGTVLKRATRGERVLGSLFPNRGTGWPGGWSQDRLEQVTHLKNWTMVAINVICSKTASVLPNLAYVHNRAVPGKTVKACQRSLLNLQNKGFGGTAIVGDGSRWDYGTDWSSVEALISGGPHSFLTVGEYRSKALSVVKPHEDLEPLDGDHRLRRIVENPNPYDTTFDLVYEMQMFEELTGVSYLWAYPNDFGMPAELWVLPSHWVWPRTGGGKYVTPNSPHADELIQYYEVRPWGGMGSAGTLIIPPNEIIRNSWKSPLNKIDGYSKLAAIAQWIDSEESISKSRWSQFGNQARPEFWLELGPGYEDPDDDRIARVEAKIAAKIQGEYNYGKPIITPPGAKVTPLSFSPTEMAYFQSEEQIRDMILSAFGVPPAAVGIVREMTYGSILATLASLCSFCLNPRLLMRGQRLTKDLASRWDETFPAFSTMTGKGHGGGSGSRRVRLWWDDCVPADPTQVNSDIAQDIQGYAITPNEVRALRGRKPYRSGGDDPMGQGPGGVMPIPLNTGEDLEELAKLIAPMSQATDQSGGEGDAEGSPEMPGMPGMPSSADNAEEANDEAAEAEGMESANIENPNGPPDKSMVEKGSKRVRKAPIAAGLAVVADDTKRVLMLQRPFDSDDLNSGKWEFPGGKIDPGETPFQAALREWAEETGMDLPDNSGLNLKDSQWLSSNGKYQGYVLHVPSERVLNLQQRISDPDSGNVAAVAWVHPRDLPSHNTRPALLSDVDQVIASVSKHLLKGLVVRKDKGTCDQGERADLTGCTPASGGGGKKPQASKPESSSSKGSRPGYEAMTRNKDGSYSGGSPEMQARAKKMKIPPAWTNVQVSKDPNAKILALGKDEKGRTQYTYNPAFRKGQDAKKFQRVRAFVNKLPVLYQKIRQVIAGKGAAGKDEAAVLMLMRKTGFRIGSEVDTKADKQALGATTLTSKNVKINGDVVTFDFIGKKGVHINQKIKDAELAKMLTPRLKSKGKLFNTSDTKVRGYMQSITPGFKPKDLRTVVAAETALIAIGKIKAPTNEKEYKKARAEIGKVVSEKLGNTPTVALASYIPPEVFTAWQENLKGAKK